MLPTLRLGDKGERVKDWQNFLRGRDLYLFYVDGDFGKRTFEATKAFQSKYNLKADGVVGTQTYLQAGSLGLPLVKDKTGDQYGPGWPEPPPDLMYLERTGRTDLFGSFRFKAVGTEDNPEAIQVLDNWYQENIVMVPIPQLKGIKGTGKHSSFPFHKRVAEQVQKLFKAWQDKGLLVNPAGEVILTWHGSYCARFIRGVKVKSGSVLQSKNVNGLSNHSYGTAFDINMKWNYLGHEPALVGKKGCVRELVKTANKLGFWWGGHYSSRKDGMHFEVVKLLF